MKDRRERMRDILIKFKDDYQQSFGSASAWNDREMALNTALTSLEALMGEDGREPVVGICADDSKTYGCPHCGRPIINIPQEVSVEDIEDMCKGYCDGSPLGYPFLAQAIHERVYGGK